MCVWARRRGFMGSRQLFLYFSRETVVYGGRGSGSGQVLAADFIWIAVIL